ncbi:MAG: UDP-3-O-(3-hydroxymyristoyl)glucosamine N-acyltransferase [Planctomycetota bacterium]
MPRIILRELARELNATLRGDADTEIVGCATLEEAGENELSFLSNARYATLLSATRAAAVLVNPDDAERVPSDRSAVIVDDPYFAFRQAMVLLHGFRQPPEVGISPQGFIHETAVVGELCTVRPFAYVAPRAHIGDRVILYPGCYVGKDAVIGSDCVLYPGVCVYDRCVLGNRVTLHANTVIGQDGFGFASSHAPGDSELRHHKIPQAGNTVVQDDVDMGANCSIDRAAMGSTVIGAGSKLSDHVVIGHGVKLGRHNLLVAHVGIAGSTVTGDYVTMGGQVGVAGHLNIGDRVQIAASSKVMHDIPPGEQWGGTPARPLTETKRMLLQQQRLPEMAKKIKALEKRLTKLETLQAATNPVSPS